MQLRLDRETNDGTQRSGTDDYWTPNDCLISNHSNCYHHLYLFHFDQLGLCARAVTSESHLKKSGDQDSQSSDFTFFKLVQAALLNQDLHGLL